MINQPDDAVVADESTDGLSQDAREAALPYTQAAADTGCPTCGEANELIKGHRHFAGSTAKESQRPMAVAGREGALSILEDVDALIRSSRNSQDSYRESEHRIATVERQMCEGYARVARAIRNLLAADLQASRRIAERNRPDVELDCVGDVQ